MDEAYLLTKLRDLRQKTDAAIRRVKKGGRPDEAINWGDLRCIEATYCLADDGGSYFRVLIEEAGDAPQFRQLVTKGLYAEGWHGVVVETGW